MVTKAGKIRVLNSKIGSYKKLIRLGRVNNPFWIKTVHVLEKALKQMKVKSA